MSWVHLPWFALSSVGDLVAALSEVAFKAAVGLCGLLVSFTVWSLLRSKMSHCGRCTAFIAFVGAIVRSSRVKSRDMSSCHSSG